MRAARLLGVPPWELERESLVWEWRALALEEMERGR
jgi:hypothetical protein